MNPFKALAAVLVYAVWGCRAYTTIIQPSTQECYKETVSEGGHFSMSFEVLEDASIQFDARQVIKQIPRTSFGEAEVRGHIGGKYQYCFLNLDSSRPATINFNGHGEDTEEFLNAGGVETKEQDEVSKLTHEIEQVGDYFTYLLFRSELHVQRVMDTNWFVARVSYAMPLILVSTGVGQLYYLRKLFRHHSSV
ncbi:hypothetical protein GQ54DRAFT_255717 [Martensiomyces pterosporus]|nr:hypothetical protein GQ54DRAFT_255717 [Martensiomyces pterosporus]